MSTESELSRIKNLMSELGVSPNKNLGQNFLINQKVIHKIVTHIDLTDQAVVEIGPGLGALTTQIKNYTHNLLLIEFDQKLSEYWQKQGFKVEHIDALKKNWSDLKLEQKILISNLPYDISASLVVLLSTSMHSIQSMVLMFQKEVAQRIAAVPNNKNYGLLSVVAQNMWEVKKVADLRSNDFYPAPKIESRVLAFKVKPGTKADKGFLSFVKHSFLNRRKMVVKNLNSYGQSLGLCNEVVKNCMLKQSIDLKSRPENITPREYLQLYNDLNQALS